MDSDDAADPRQAVIRRRMATKYGEVDDQGAPNRWARTALLVEVCPEQPPIA